MEDTKLKILPGFTSKPVGSLLRHQGLALPTVLLAAIVGAFLVATIFDIASRFGMENILFRRTYADQTTATSHIERAKGLIAAKIATDKEALHPMDGDDWNEHPAINSLGDIQIFLNGDRTPPDPLVVDEALPENRRVTMNVYDLTYMAANVPPPPTVSVTQRLLLPAPIDLTSVASSSNHWSGHYADGDLSTNRPPDAGGASELDLKTFGAYLVRVEIFNQDGRLARRAEEAFFIRADAEAWGGSGEEP